MPTYKEFNIEDLKYVNAGCYGSYYKLKKKKNLGIKILAGEFDTKHRAISAFTDYVSPEYKKLVSAAKRTRSVPRPRGLVIVKERHPHYKHYIYRIGYMMTHVVGRTISQCYMSRALADKLYRTEYRLEQLGIYLDDNHNENIIKSKNRIIFIDAARFKIRNNRGLYE